jgi:hypothetical protein
LIAVSIFLWGTGVKDLQVGIQVAIKHYTGVPLYLVIQYLRFQLFAVHGSLKRNWKVKEINGS